MVATVEDCGANDGGDILGFGNLGDIGQKKNLSKYEKERQGGILSEEERKMEDFGQGGTENGRRARRVLGKFA